MATGLDAVYGEITDVDAHELIPTNMWADVFGEVGGQVVPLGQRDDSANANAPGHDVSRDDLPITDENVWKIRPRLRAPGAFDMRRRIEVLDHIGVRRQLLFPGFGLFALAARRRSHDELATMLGLDPSQLDVSDLMSRIVTAHNAWAIEQLEVDADRLRPVGILIANSVEDAFLQAEQLLSAGIRHVWLPSANPIGGVSPAHPEIDPLWSLFEESNATVLNHIGGGAGFYNSEPWRIGVTAFEGATTAETSVDPHAFASMSMAPSHYLLTMVLGGVFERHPALRFGSIEFGANWIGPLAASMDMWAAQSSSMRSTLSLKPSQYLRRNVRVSAFPFEPIDEYLIRYEKFDLEDVYCFATDYPHVEGGESPMKDAAERLAPFGEEIVQKFFVTNGMHILPPLDV